MDNSIGSHEQPLMPEREYNPFLDLCPLEHILIGSSVFPDNAGKIFNLGALKKDGQVAKDKDFLLKPLGLANGERVADDIVKARAEKKHLSGWTPCFKPTSEFVVNYSFDYILSQPDSNNMIPNKFEFKFRKNDSEDSVLTAEDINSFRKIELAESFRELFKLTGDESKGIFTITYLPLEQRPKNPSRL